jgi:hypothetical protein
VKTKKEILKKLENMKEEIEEIGEELKAHHITSLQVNPTGIRSASENITTAMNRIKCSMTSEDIK